MSVVIPAGHEVYVLLEGVFQLDHAVDDVAEAEGGSPTLVRVRTANGTRITLPIQLIAEWDVESVISAESGSHPSIR